MMLEWIRFIVLGGPYHIYMGVSTVEVEHSAPCHLYVIIIIGVYVYICYRYLSSIHSLSYELSL